MENVTYIIPLYQWDQIVEEYLENAVESIAKTSISLGDRIMLIGPKDVITHAEKTCKAFAPNYAVQKIENDETDFFVQVNKAALACVTPYFTILEYDDTIKPYWNDILQSYSVKSPFLIPLNLLIKDGQPYTLANEVGLSTTFASGDNGIGVIDVESLKDYVEFNLTGGLFKTEDFISIGGLKPSLKITAWYEFLLRAAYNNKPVFVVPKIAYLHTINRPGSFMETVSKGIKEEEAEWLIETARQEYFFKEDRNKTYQEKTTGEGEK